MIIRIFLFASSFLLAFIITTGAASIEFEEILTFSVPEVGNIEKCSPSDPLGQNWCRN